MRLKSYFYFTFILLAFLTFSNCTIGLGSAVDTQAPTIDISYPPANASVKGEFLLSGTWSDDRGLKEILVEVYKNKDSEPCDTAYATINSNKTWTLTLNKEDEKSEISDSEDNGFYQGWKYSDGEYQIQVTASDNGGHTSQTAKTTLNIDNTPPVLILTKPTSVGENTAKSYGQTVQLEGTFSEATDKTIDNLTVTFYDSTGNALFDSEFTGITDMSNANPLVIAQYYSEAAEPSDSDSDNYIKWENYKKLYSESEIAAYRNDPTTSIDTKQFYFSVTASDQAREYTNTSETEGSGQGNTTRYYYRGTSDMLTLVNGKDSSFSNFSVAMLQNYLNKTDETYQDNSALESILSAAQSVSVESGLKSDGSARAALSAETTTDSIADCINNTNTSQGNVYLNFSINPKNNPTFEVSKMSLADSTSKSESQYTDGYYKYLTETTLHVSLNPGLDNTNLDTPTVSIYYVKNGSEEKQLLWTWDEDVALAYAKKQTALASQSDAYIIELLNRDPETYRYTKTAEDENSDGLSIDTTLSTKDKEILAGSKYTIIVEGYDIESQSFVAKDIAGYGFIATSNSTVPDLDFDEESGTTNLETSSTIKASVVEGNNLKFTGYVESADELSDVESLYYIITIKDNSDSSKTKTVKTNITGSDKVLQNGSQYIYDWSFTFEPDSYVTNIIDNGSGFYKISVDVYATNGGGTAHIGRNYYLDTQIPEIPIVTVSSGYTDKNSGTIYLNNTNTFTLSGTTTDNFIPGITSAVFTGKDSDGKTKTLTKNSSSGDITWEFTDVDLSGFAVQNNATDVTLTVTAKDSGGNEASVNYNLEFDTTAPAGYHLYDKLNKDLIFRVGEYDNTSTDLTAAGATWDDDLDEDVGGKYSTGTWGTSQTITVRGDFVEEGSGLKMIYYKIFDEAPDADAIASFESNYASDYTGMISPLTGDDVITRRVLYTKADGISKGYKEVDSSFKAALSGFKNKNNYLLLLAVDNVGNAGLDTLMGTYINDSSVTENIDWNTPQGKTEGISSISLNVDTDAPDVSSTTSGTQYTNKVSKITVEGSAEDTDSGLASVVIKIIGKDSSENALEKEISATGTSSWSADITTDNLKDLVAGNTYSVKAIASDNAGNSTTNEIFKLMVDTTAPDVQLSSPSTSTRLNGLKSMSGLVSYEGSAPESLELYASKEVPSGDISDTSKFTMIKEIKDVSQIYSWSVSDINTYDLTDVESAPKTALLYIIPVVTDGAGNINIYDIDSESYVYKENINYFKYTVDMDSDRPTVKVTNLTLTDGTYILKYGEDAQIEGTVTDDDSTSDAVLKTFVATTSQITGTGTVSKTTNNTTGVVTSKVKVGTKYDITTFNPSTGEWTFTPADTGDGEKTVYFYIVDNKDTVFYTGKTETVEAVSYTYHQPYFQYKTSTAEDASDALTYRSDATAPSITNTLVQAYDSTKAAKDAEIAPGTNLYVGGVDKQFVKFKITGYDANEIEGIRLTLNYKDSENEDDVIKIASCSDYTDDGFTQNGSISGTTTAVWTTDYIDHSVMKTGSISGTIEVFDKSGLLGTSSPIYMVDNDGPAVRFSSPSSDDELTGDITFSGTCTDTGNAGVRETAWLIPTAAQRDLSDAELAAATKTVAGETVSVWNTELDENTSVSLWQFTLESSDLDDYDNATYYLSETNSVYTLPFYIKTTDELGTVTIYRDFTFNHNPNADRPQVELLYPVNKDVSYVTLGGAIRISGSAVIPSNTTTVNSVYVQIVGGAGNLEDDESIGDKYTLTKAYAVSKKFAVLTKDQIQSTVGKTLSFADELDWGIKADKTGSWSLTINEGGELDPDEEELTYIAIRACAVNAEGKVGTWTDWVYVNIDDTAPTQSAMLYQFTSNPTAGCTASTVISASNIEASSLYKSDMYLKGEWYLTVKLHDEFELSSYTVTKKLDGGSSTSVTPVASTKVTGSDGKEKTQYLFIPVDTTANTVEYSVVVRDSEHTITDTYTLKIDNTAPVIEKVYKGSTDNSANYLKTNEINTVADSNYIYTLGGKVEETGSGFKRLAFYFVRANKIDGETYKTEAVLDPLVTTGTSDAKASISGNLEAREFIQDDDTYYLYSKEVKGALGEDGDTFIPSTAADITGNAHIRKGGLIEVAGLLRRIDSIDSTTGEVSFSPETGITDEPELSAYFAYAQVVDNTSTESVESQSANPFTFKNSSDDGDKLPETLTGSTSVGYSWDATIHSYNIPDGPCALVVLAFDDAGNVSGATYPAKIENSAPRLAKVYFGTDLNSSNTWSANEFTGYNVYDANNTYGIDTTEVKASQSISTDDYGDVFTIKDKLAVVAEIVGGNGTITMVYGRGATTTTPVRASGTGAGISATADNTITSVITDTVGTVTYNNAETFTTLKGFTLTNAQIVAAVTEANDGIGKKASFTFWDSTDELTPGVNSQNCVLQVSDFTIDLVDSVPPKVVVNPFYWKSSSVNSLYGASTANGHIELEGDLTGTTAATTYGTDPKVSGKITFTGTAYDEHALKSLSFTLANSTGTAITGFSNITMATYDPSSTDETYVANGGWSALSGNSGSAVTDGGKYEWTLSADNSGTEKTTGYYEDTYYLGQGGHKVYWTISIDSEQIPNVAETDVTLTVTAEDQADNSSDDNEEDDTIAAPASDKTDAKEYHVPSYQMDIVPYIAGIKSNLSKLKKANSSLYDRTALGHYPVASGETIYVYGFNLSGGTLYDSTTGTPNSAALSAAITGDTLTGQKWYSTSSIPSGSVYPVGSITAFKSGDVYVSVKNVTSLNNKNNDDAKGAYIGTTTSVTGDSAVYANYYNRKPNGDNNNILTDNVSLDVWEFDNSHIVPISGKIEQPVMKINPNNDKIGFAFVNGPLYFSMGGGTGNENYSYTYWMGSFDFFTSVGFTYDKLGYSYGVAAGGDINSNSADKFQLMTSRWGHASRAQNGSYGNTNSLRLESIGQKGDAAGNNTDTNFFDKQRIQSPSLTTSVHRRNDNDYTYLYMAYYDQMNDEIRFRYGYTNSTTAGGFGAFTDKETDGAPYTYANGASSVVQMVTGSSTGNNSGAYLSIGVVSANGTVTSATGIDDVVVLVWYDATERCLMYTYNDSPVTNRQGNKTATGWSTPVRVFAEGTDFENTGEYCKVAVDNDGGIHIACYDPVNLDLDYAYLPSSFGGKPTAQTDFETCVVDSNGVTGSNITLDVAKVGSDWIPYIGYYMTSCIKPKLAYKVATTSNAPAGSDDDSVTGNWEIQIIPTTQTVEMQSNQHNDINVGVWKNKDTGVMKTSLTTTSSSNSNSNTPNGYSSTSYGQIYGNGKTDANGNLYPVLGYAVKYGATGDHIETAQMR